MTTIDLSAPIRVAPKGGPAYAIRFQPLATLPALMDEAELRQGRCLVVTDTNVASHYLDSLEAILAESGWTPKAVVLTAGEQTKSYTYLHSIYDAALAWQIDRKTPILALGGGVVGDLAGFAAATLLRGLPLVQLPTTLIAQVDSAIGGKTGINHTVGKNLIGAFHQPRLVCADVQTLQTLPRREWTSGLAEVFKHALIADTTLFDFLEAHIDAVVAQDPEVTPQLIYRAAGIKAEVVSEDVYEQGRRAILNFGHTFGHAIERGAGYGQFTHGEAVALGMRTALHLSQALHTDLPLARADRLVQHIPVPSTLSNLKRPDLMAAMQVDKKVDAGTLRFVVLRHIGEAYVTGQVNPTDVEAAWTFAQGLA